MSTGIGHKTPINDVGFASDNEVTTALQWVNAKLDALNSILHERIELKSV